MRFLTFVASAAVMNAVVFAAAPANSAEGVTWRREQVRQWELAAMERALGKDFVAKFRIVPYIVGGTIAPTGRWPFQVALLDANVPNNYQAQFCGGSLIDRQFVVTAAHCVFGASPADIDVLTGTQNLNSGGTRRQVTEIRINPNYNNRTTDFDIAVIKLGTAVDGVPFVQLLSRDQEASLAPAGTPTTVIGWGTTSANTGNYPVRLRQVVVPLVSRQDCNDQNSYDGEITSRMICAGLRAGGKDSCSGDSGGPLLVRNHNRRWIIQAGVVSWGIGCALPDLYGVYTRVAVLSAWVNRIVAGLGPAYSSGDCAALPTATQLPCLDRALADNKREMKSDLAALRARSNSVTAATIDASQRAWTNSLEALCMVDAVFTGETGRKFCLLKETEKRAAMLSAKLSIDD